MNIVYIPSGPINLAILFPGLDFSEIDNYRISVLNNISQVIATSNRFINEVECTDNINLHFVNLLGAIDSVPFKIINIDNETKSGSIQTPLTHPLVKNVHGINRFNIKSNDIYQIENEFKEEDMEWLTELFISPLVWMEWKGTQSQPDDYIPIVIADKKIQKRKDAERYSYTVSIDFLLSHEKIAIRG